MNEEVSVNIINVANGYAELASESGHAKAGCDGPADLLREVAMQMMMPSWFREVAMQMVMQSWLWK